MSSDLTLSGGICQRLNAGDSNDESIWSTKPTLQFLSIKKVVPGTNPGPNNPSATTDRYRIIISDGLHFLQAMLATQLNYLVEEDRIGKNTIALIENMSCQTITDKRSVSRLLFCSEISWRQQACDSSRPQGLTERCTQSRRPCPYKRLAATTKNGQCFIPQRACTCSLFSYSSAAKPTSWKPCEPRLSHSRPHALPKQLAYQGSRGAKERHQTLLQPERGRTILQRDPDG